MEYIVLLAALLVLLFVVFRNKKPIKLPPFPKDWKKVLAEKVEFYRELSPDDKIAFENRVHLFIYTTKVTGINTTVDDTDRLLVAASAIIPVFSFPNWEYINLKEVLLYPSSFNEKFQYGQNDSRIQGMVGTGYMEGKMILSKPSLHVGFNNHNDKKNVGIHEFTHLIDKTDGVIDGIPSLLLDKQYTIPWIDLIKKKMDEIHALKSDINSYGGVSETEFFPVITEYFFERPKLLQRKHPELYKLLNDIYTVDLSKKYKNMKRPSEIGRNDKCLCGSGKKFKHCCGKI